MNDEHIHSSPAMAALRSCPGCGASIRPGAPEELCPKCLIGFGLGLNPGQSAPPKSRAVDSGGGEPAPGRCFGDYELIEEIARGGMGIVYRARQRSLNRIVAVKILLFGQFASTQFVKRFQAEAEAVGSLHHPNIVGIYAFGEHDGQHYFAMEFIEGRSLAEVARDRPMPSHQAAALLKTIAQAIDYAHSRGILHRDLKPSNVLLDIADQPRVTDFGLAKRLSGDTEITLTGQVLGSPSYMAPEQISPEGGSISPASDVYSLGAILYDLLAGRPPFMADTVETTLAQVLIGDPLPLRRLNPSIPIDLETICSKCLEREPARRYSTARELADELGRFLNGEPIHARPVSFPEKAWRWAMRNPVPASLSAALLGVLAIFLAYSVVSSNHLRREAQRALQAEKQTTAELGRSYLAQARAERRSGQAGQTFDALEAIRKATEIAPSLELRNEAIAALALTDVRMVNTWSNNDTGLTLCYSDSLQRYAVQMENGEIGIRRATNSFEELRVPATSAAARWIGGFSADEQKLAVNYRDNENYVWDLTTGKPFLPPLPGLVCVMLPHVNEVVVAGTDSMLRFYSCANGELLRSWPVAEPQESIAFTRGAPIIATFRHGSPVLHVFEFPSGRERFSIVQPAEIGSAVLSPDGGLVAAGCSDHSINIWETSTATNRATLEGHENNIIALAFNHAGDLLASASWDNTSRLWDLASARQVLGMPGATYQFRFSPDDRALAHVVHGGLTGMLELRRSEIFREIRGRSGTYLDGWCVALSSDGRLAATGHPTGFVIWDVARGTEIISIPHGHWRSAMFLPDGSGLVTSGSSLVLWPLHRTVRGDYEEVSIGQPHRIRYNVEFTLATLSRDGAWVAAANTGAGGIEVYEVAHPENRFVLTNLDRVQFVSAPSDMRWIAGGTWNGKGVKVWDVARRAVVCELPFEGSTTVAFSPDGKLLGTACGAYQVWESGSWRKLYEVQKPDVETGIGAMAFSPDSRWLALVENGRAVVLFEAATGKEIASFSAPRQPAITALSFSIDATKLAGVQSDGNIQMWDLRATRAKLAGLKLDWNDPAFPAIDPASPQPLPCVGILQPFTREELAEKIPARLPSTPSTLIELSRYFNAPLTESWTGEANTGNDLRELSCGKRDFGGVPFDVRGVLQLAVPALPGWFPTNVTGIKIGQRCRSLHFLHSTAWGAPEGEQIAGFIIHFHDGRQVEFPIRYGAEVRDWWERLNEPELTSKNSDVAWRGHNPRTRADGALGLRIFKTTWQNPQPDAVIESIDFQSALTSAAPFLLGVTAEP